MNKETKANKLSKNFIWNLVGSSLYACTSLLFLIIVTRINGVEDAGIFTFAFSFICMIQVIGTYAGRTYQVTERNKKINDSDYMYFRVINCILMAAFCLIFIAFKDYSAYKNIIIILLLSYRLIDSYSEVLYGIFQKNNNLYQVGISLTLRSVLTVSAFLAIDLICHNLLYATIGILITDIVIFILYDIRLFSKYKIKWFKFNKKNLKILIIGGFAVFVFTFLMQYIVNAPKFAIDDLLTESDQAIFGIILMPATLMLLCSQLIINPFLYNLNKSLEEKNYKQFRKTVYKICLAIVLLGIAAILLCYIIGIPVLNLLYNINLEGQLLPLMIIVAGSIVYGISSVFSNALIAIRKNTVQVVLYCIATVFAFCASFYLVSQLSILGAAIAYCSTVSLLFVLYTIIFSFETKRLICKNR